MECSPAIVSAPARQWEKLQDLGKRRCCGATQIFTTATGVNEQARKEFCGECQRWRLVFGMLLVDFICCPFAVPMECGWRSAFFRFTRVVYFHEWSAIELHVSEAFGTLQHPCRQFLNVSVCSRGAEW